MDLGLKGKVALITGGSSGIGAGVCRVLASEGCDIVINYCHSQAKAEAHAQELIEKYGVRAIAVKADCGVEEEVIAMFKEAVEKMGTLDILMNNAYNVSTAAPRIPFTEQTLDDLRRVEKVVIEGTFICTREFIKVLKSQNKGGKIVNTLTKSMFWSSTVFNEVYATCKGAISAFTRAIAHEFGMEDIYCNAIVPGYCRNDRTDVNSIKYQRVIKFLPLKRYAEPEEMGYAVAWLCSDKALQTNGATIDLTGGTLVGDYIDKTVKFI